MIKVLTSRNNHVELNMPGGHKMPGGPLDKSVLAKAIELYRK